MTPATPAAPPSAPAATGDAPNHDLAHVSRTEFVNAMVHLYRGELGEATAWRTRIDATSNWAVVLSATALSFVFADKSSERHVLIPIITLFVTFMLFMEARRYRFYDIWRTRARLLEINFYRPLLDGSPPTDAQWTATLAHDLEWPHFHMPWWEAAGRRLRRNYQWIYGILLASWLILLLSHPTPTTDPAEFAARGGHRADPRRSGHRRNVPFLRRAGRARRLQPVEEPLCQVFPAGRPPRPPAGRTP